MRGKMVAAWVTVAAVAWAVPAVAEHEHEHEHTIPLKIKESASCFSSDFSQFPYITFYGVGDQLDLKPFGTSSLNWHVQVLATQTGLDFVEGSFAWTLPNNDKLSGEYTGFTINAQTGDYELDWLFTDGTGEVDDAHGTGVTHGMANLSTLCAQFSFKGKIKVEDDDH